MEKVLKKAVLVFLVRDNEICLARKLKKIGAGKLNGYGGGINEGETEIEAVVREGQEEGGFIIEPSSLKKIAILHFYNHPAPPQEPFVCTVHIYTASNWDGEIVDTDEMADHKWYPIDDLPLSDMLPADRKWLPIALSGKKIVANAYYSSKQKEEIKPVELKEVDDLPMNS